MIEQNILSHPILADIYHRLIEGWQHSDKPNTIKQQALTIIKQLLLRKIFDHYKAPKFFYLALTDNITEKLRRYLKQKYERIGQNISDEELEEAINNIVADCELVINQQIAEGIPNV